MYNSDLQDFCLSFLKSKNNSAEYSSINVI